MTAPAIATKEKKKGRKKSWAKLIRTNNRVK
jgi:hypothetical protein